MSEFCENKSFEGVSLAYRRALIAVKANNADMFIAEMPTGVISGSQALNADREFQTQQTSTAS